MASRVVGFADLSEQDRRAVSPLPRLAPGDRMELHVRRSDGGEHILALPQGAAGAIETLINRLLNGDRVAVLAEEQELSPTEAADVLGVSRPLVVLRMDRGDLPFRYVGKHRRALLRDVLALKTRLDARQKALDALAGDTEELIVDHGL